MFQAIKSFLGLDEPSSDSASETEFSSLGTLESSDERENSDELEQEDRADFQRGDRVSFCPAGRQWVNARVLKYRYPNNFTLKVEGDSGRVCLGIKREDLRLPIKSVPTINSLVYKKGEVVDVKRKRQIRSLEDARRAMTEDMAVENPNDKFDDSKWAQGQILKVNYDPVDSGAPPWYKIRFVKEDGSVEVDRDVKEINVRKVFRKGDLCEVRAEGWAEYYRGRVVKKTGRRQYHILIQEDGEIVKNCERVRMRAVGDFKDVVGKHVSDAYRALRRRYTNYLKSGNFMRMLRMIENDGIHPDHEDPLSGRNGLIRCCLANQVKRAKQFVECGADVDYETSSGLTPLIACAEKGSVRCAKVILLDPWNRPLANPFRKNKLGKTAREVAVQHKRTRFIAFLDELISKADYEYARRKNVEIVMNDPGAIAAAAAAALKRLQRMAVTSHEEKVKAACALQARFRGYLSRKHERQRFEQEAREEAERKEAARRAGIKKFYFTINAVRLQRAYRRMIKYEAQLLRFRQNEAARVITRLFRSVEARVEKQRRLALQQLFDSTAHIRLIKNYVMRFRQRQIFLRTKRAAITCQCAWRSFVARVYFSELMEDAWIEERRRARHIAIVTELREKTERMWWLIRVERAKEEWQAGNVLVRSVRRYWFRMQRMLAANTIRRCWWCYRARQQRESLGKWAVRTDAALQKSMWVRGLEPTYTMAPDGRKHPGLGLSRRRKACRKCDCKEFAPAPQESMCTSSGGVPVCRCGHHMVRHVYVSGRGGGYKLRLTWKEKIAEALELPVTELLVRGLYRSDARRDEYLRLRANVKQAAQQTDTRRIRRAGKVQPLGKAKNLKMGRKKGRTLLLKCRSNSGTTISPQKDGLHLMETLASPMSSFAQAMVALDTKVSTGPPMMHDVHPDLVLKQLELSLARGDPLPEVAQELEQKQGQGQGQEVSEQDIPSFAVRSTNHFLTMPPLPPSPSMARRGDGSRVVLSTAPAISPSTSSQLVLPVASSQMSPQKKQGLHQKKRTEPNKLPHKHSHSSIDHPLFLRATPRLNVVRQKHKDDTSSAASDDLDEMTLLMRKNKKRKKRSSRPLADRRSIQGKRSGRKSPRGEQRPQEQSIVAKEEIGPFASDMESTWVLKLIPCSPTDKDGNDDEEHERSRAFVDPKQSRATATFLMVEHARVRIGRARDCEMTLDSELFPKILSKQHAAIVFMRSRRPTRAVVVDNHNADSTATTAAATAKLVPVLVDTGSTNGTLVNGRKASKRKPILLENDVVLVFGGKKSDLAYKVEIKEMVSQESAGHSSSTSKSKKSKR